MVSKPPKRIEPAGSFAGSARCEIDIGPASIAYPKNLEQIELEFARKLEKE
jgi:hypothetical protein